MTLHTFNFNIPRRSDVFVVYLVTFAEEIPNGKLHFLCSGNCCTETGVTKDSQTPPVEQQISNILTIVENLCSSLEAVKKRFMKIEDHRIGLGNPISATNPNAVQDNFYTNL